MIEAAPRPKRKTGKTFRPCDLEDRADAPNAMPSPAEMLAEKIRIHAERGDFRACRMAIDAAEVDAQERLQQTPADEILLEHLPQLWGEHLDALHRLGIKTFGEFRDFHVHGELEKRPDISRGCINGVYRGMEILKREA